MSELDKALRKLADNGELTYLSLAPVAGKSETGVVFSARVAPASRFGHSDGRDADPVKALLQAIEGLPKSVKTGKRKRVAKEFGDPDTTDEPAALALDEVAALPPRDWDIV